MDSFVKNTDVADKIPTQIQRINGFLESGPHPIDPIYGKRLLSKFMAEMETAASGGEELLQQMIREKREANRPRLITAAKDGTFSVAEISTLETTQGAIALLQLNGAMYQDDFLSTKGMRSLADDIRALDNNPNISGIILEVNTGGGESLAGQTLKSAIKDARKPILVYAHFMASAGVWGTLHATHIMAAGKGSEFGSIGVFTQVDKDFLAAYKERVLSIYSRKSPNKNIEFRSLLDGDIEPMQQFVTDLDDIFMSDVRRYRSLSGDIDGTLAGGMFFASDAKARGLVDSIGTFKDAVAEMQRIIRKQNQQKEMKKFSFIEAAKKFLGIEVATEEEAQTALAEAEAPNLTEMDEKFETVTSKFAEIETKMADLEAAVVAFKADLEDKLAQVTAGAITSEAMTQEITDAIQTAKTEIAEQINEIKTKSSGKSATDEGDGILKAEKAKKEEGKEKPIDLLAGVKARKVTVLQNLQ